MEMRLYPWLVDGTLADPTDDALKRLAEGGVLDLATATADDEQPCPERTRDFVMFGKPTRAIHVKTTTGQRVVIAAGHADGSLVGVVGIVAPGQVACAGAGDMDSAIRRLTGAMAGNGDSARPPVSASVVEDPTTGRPIEFPAADPAPPSP